MVDRPTMNALDRIWRRLSLLIGRGRIKVGDDSGAVQTQQVQVNDQEIHDGMPRIVEYGFTSMPKPGCQALVIFVGGERTNGVIVGTNDETNRKKNLLPGEVAIYDDLGQSVYLTRAGIVVNGGGLPVLVTNTPTITLDSPQVNATGNIHAVGNITSDANVQAAHDVLDQGGTKSMSGMRAVFDPHTHTDPQGGSTGTPSASM